MLVVERESKILILVNASGSVSVRDLAQTCGVTEVTIRRDLQRLEARNKLKRAHGGAISKDVATGGLVVEDSPTPDIQLKADALIIAPVQNREAHALRERAKRNGIPYLAESAPQSGAIYLGPDNLEAGRSLGYWTGKAVLARGWQASVLEVTQQELANTRERSQGFAEGFRTTLDMPFPFISVDGGGVFSKSYQVALAALKLHPQTNVIFGVNDDSVLGAVQAYLELERDPTLLLAVNVGGEGTTLLEALAKDGPLAACVALFPDLVGKAAVDATVRLWAGEMLEPSILTPHALLTRNRLPTYYTRTAERWEFKADAVNLAQPSPTDSALRRARGKSISFVVQYRTHEWYQNVAEAMRIYAEGYGVQVFARSVAEDFQSEILELKRAIGKSAAFLVEEGDTVILDTGTTTSNMIPFLAGKRITVITNSLEVFRQLQSYPDISIKLTGGDYDPLHRALTGRGAQLLLEDMRVDKAFIVAGGVSSAFGVSSISAEEAEVRRAMIRAARQVIVLADHTLLGHESNVRVVDLSKVDVLITDAGIAPEKDLELSQHGVHIVVAGREISL